MSRFSQAIVVAMVGLLVSAAPVASVAVTPSAWTSSDQSKLNDLKDTLAAKEASAAPILAKMGQLETDRAALNQTLADANRRTAELTAILYAPINISAKPGQDAFTDQLAAYLAAQKAAANEFSLSIISAAKATASIAATDKSIAALRPSFLAAKATVDDLRTEVAALQARADQNAAQQQAARQQEAARVAKANAILALTTRLLTVKTTGQVVSLVNAAASGVPPLTKDDVVKAMSDAMAGVGQNGWYIPARAALINPVRLLVQNSKTSGDAIITLAISADSKVAVVGASGATGGNGDAGQPGASQTITAVYVG